jgi:hypothetical protein
MSTALNLQAIWNAVRTNVNIDTVNNFLQKLATSPKLQDLFKSMGALFLASASGLASIPGAGANMLQFAGDKVIVLGKVFLKGLIITAILGALGAAGLFAYNRGYHKIIKQQLEQAKTSQLFKILYGWYVNIMAKIRGWLGSASRSPQIAELRKNVKGLGRKAIKEVRQRRSKSRESRGSRRTEYERD